MVLRGCATIFVNILITTAILLSFFTFPTPDIPLQVASRFTGYPTWHGKLQHYVREQTAALLPLANDEEHLPSDDASSISPKLIDHPDQLLLLIFASFVHIIGNAFTIILSGDGRA
ncbi:22314_t:CDS:2 [Dentiscutata erythropus]|uniref:22314_t:CDS:1 n=1 Tax=Dentiscutata erythropus TaxID=1348616 RepID=A0A9N9BUC3_9GLOM|nr:22314_t:CDS:2 [Dentiscutata erythropus]